MIKLSGRELEELQYKIVKEHWFPVSETFYRGYKSEWCIDGRSYVLFRFNHVTEGYEV